MKSLHLIASASLLALPSFALAGGELGDIWVYASGGTLLTGAWDHDTSEVTSLDRRVFSAEFGEDPAFPFSTDEPGIGSNLVGTTLTMGLSPTLGAWNGSGFDFATSELMGEYGGQSFQTGSGGSFSFLVTQGLDLHAEFTLFGPGLTDPANGIYLATFEFSAAGLGTSQALWVVYNLGMDEEAHEAAIEWVEANLVPAPGAMMLLGLAGLAGRRRR
jgi:hypothetical protein